MGKRRKMVDDEIARPYRIWDPSEGKYLRYRYYKFPRNAHLGALIEARWAKPGVVYEVIDYRTAAVLGVYKRTPTSVVFTDIRKEDNGKT